MLATQRPERFRVHRFCGVGFVICVTRPLSLGLRTSNDSNGQNLEAARMMWK